MPRYFAQHLGEKELVSLHIGTCGSEVIFDIYIGTEKQDIYSANFDPDLALLIGNGLVLAAMATVKDVA